MKKQFSIHEYIKFQHITHLSPTWSMNKWVIIRFRVDETLYMGLYELRIGGVLFESGWNKTQVSAGRDWRFSGEDGRNARLNSIQRKPI